MIPNIKNPRTGAVFILLFLLIETASVFAQGGSLMVNPKRIVFEGNKRNDVLTLFNDGSDTASFAISWKHYEMQQNGEFKDVDTIKTDVMFCDTIVKFFPREVTLAPHSSQTVRMQLLKPKNLGPGEYRSHLYFRGIERAKALETPRSDTDKTITLSLKAIFGLAVPIIVRNETSPSQVTLSNLTLTAADTGRTSKLSIDINRTGNESAYGEFIVYYVDANNPKGQQLQSIKGIGIYVPLAMRRMEMKVKLPPVTSLSTGKLRVDFLTMTGDPKEKVIATADLPLKK